MKSIDLGLTNIAKTHLGIAYGYLMGALYECNLALTEPTHPFTEELVNQIKVLINQAQDLLILINPD